MNRFRKSPGCRSKVHSWKKSKSARPTSHKRHSRHTHFDSAPLTAKNRATNPHQIRRTRIQQGFRLFLYIARTKLHSACSSTPPYQRISVFFFLGVQRKIANSRAFALSRSPTDFYSSFPFLPVVGWKHRKTERGGKLKNGTSKLARRTPGTSLEFAPEKKRVESDSERKRYTLALSFYPTGPDQALLQTRRQYGTLCKKGNSRWTLPAADGEF